jgi:hypothetical protein
MSRLFMPVAIEGVFAWISRLSEETVKSHFLSMKSRTK